jgi:hypothetical protein
MFGGRAQGAMSLSNGAVKHCRGRALQNHVYDGGNRGCPSTAGSLGVLSARAFGTGSRTETRMNADTSTSRKATHSGADGPAFSGTPSHARAASMSRNTAAW